MKRSRKNTIQYEKSIKFIFRWFTWIVFLVLGILVCPAKAADVQVTVDAQQIAGDIDKRFGCGLWAGHSPEELKSLKNMGISHVMFFNLFSPGFLNGSWNGVQNTIDLSYIYAQLDSIIEAGLIPMFGTQGLPYWFKENIIPSFYNQAFSYSDATGEYLVYKDRDNKDCKLYKYVAYDWQSLWPPLNDSKYAAAYEDAIYQLVLRIGQYYESKGLTNALYFEVGAEQNNEPFYMTLPVVDLQKAAHPDPENPNWGPSPAWAQAHPGQWAELSGINERTFLMYKHFQAGIARAEAELSVPIKVGGMAGSLGFKGDYANPNFYNASYSYTDFIRFCAANNLRLDFYSIHKYGISATKTTYGTYSEDRAKLAQIAAQVANEYPNYQPIQGNLEILNTECGSSWGLDLNNIQGSYPAAWLFEYLSSGLGLGIYLSNRDSGNGIDWEGEDYGLRTDSGINKALVSAIRIHNRLIGDKLLWTKADSLLGRVGVKASKYSDDPQRMSVVLWNYIFRGNVVDANGNIVTGPADPAKIYDYHYTNPDQSVAITVKNLPGWPRVQCRRYLIDKTHSNPLYFKDVAPQNHQYLEEVWPIRTFTCGDGYLSPDGKTLTLPDELLKGSSDGTLQGSVLYIVLANDIPREVVKNPGFEYLLNAWIIPYYVAASYDSSVKFDGSNSLKVNCSYGGGYVYQQFNVKPGRTYAASLYYKSDGAGLAHALIALGPEDSDTSARGYRAFTWQGAQTAWTRPALSFVVPEGGFEPGYPAIGLASYYPGSGFVWYDDIVVEQEGVYIANGSFERDAIKRGMPDKWTAPYYIEAAIDETASVTGTRSLKMSCRQGGGFISQRLFNLKPRTMYRGVLWHKSDGAGLASARVVFGPEDSNTSARGYRWFTWQGTQTAWTRQELSFVVPEGGFEPGYPRIDLASYYPGSGFVWFDGIVVEENSNYVANGSFERDLDLDGRPDSWCVPYYVNALIVEKTELGQSEHEVLSGHQALKLNCEIGGGWVSQVISVEPNKEYSAFLSYKTDGIGLACARIVFGPEEEAGGHWLTYKGAAASWQAVKIDFTVPDGGYAPGYPRLELASYYPGSGFVWYDDVGVVEKEEQIVNNGTFEKDMLAWTPSAWSISRIVADSGPDGSQALAVSRYAVSQQLSLAPNTDYVIDFWYCTEPGAMADVVIQSWPGWDAGWKFTWLLHKESPAWTRATIPFHTASAYGGSDYPRLTFGYGDWGNASAYFDNVQVYLAAAEVPVVRNGDFKEGMETWTPSAWSISRIVANSGPDGSQALAVSRYAVSQQLSLAPNTDYVIDFWYRTEPGAKADVIIQSWPGWWDAGWKFTWLLNKESPVWTRATIPFRTASAYGGNDYPRLTFGYNDWGNASAYFDNVQVYLAEAPVVRNGDFKEGMETWTPSAWSISRIVADSGPDGSQALAVSRYAVSQQLSLAPNTDYVIDFWYRTEPGAMADVVIQSWPGWDAGWKFTWLLHKESPEWTHATIPFYTASAYGGSDYPCLTFGYGDWGNASAYFDNVQVYLAQ